MIVLVLLYTVVGPLLVWKRSELLFEVFGFASGLIVVVIVWLMVTKPS